MKRDFSQMTKEQIHEILLWAVATGDWHEPSVSDLEIKEQHIDVVYGKFTTSLHNTYHDDPRIFNLNNDTLQLWQNADLPGRVKTVRYTVHNIRKIIELVDAYTTAQKEPERKS